MKNLRSLYLRITLAVTLVTGAIAPVALAQPVLTDGPAIVQVVEAPDPAPFDIAAWFADTAALAAVVVAAVAFLRAHLLKSLSGVAVIITSLIVGGILGAIGSALGYVEGGVTSGLMFGVTAGFLASGGWDAIGGLLGKSRAPAG